MIKKNAKAQVDFKKELESASRGMIMIHDPKLLIKLIVRMIVRNLGVRHAAMLLFEPEKNAFVLSISRGEKGIKIPPGFTRFGMENPLIQLFLRNEYKPLTVDRNAIVLDDINRMIWRENVVHADNGNQIKELLQKVDEQMQMLNLVACVPAYYQKRLMAVLLLGEKNDLSPFDQEELDFFAALASDAAMAIRNAQLFEDLKAEAERNRELFIQTIRVLSSAIEAKDAYTHGHTERVTKYSLAIARQMNQNGTGNFKEEFFENLYISGLLHDIGKIGVPEEVLNKTGKLTDAEFDIMKKHTVIGADMVEPLRLEENIVYGIKFHHERWDGRGYPAGLKEHEIPEIATIIAVADAFDAMTSDRPYRKGMDKSIAIQEIRDNVNKQFAPDPARAMLELWDKGVI